MAKFCSNCGGPLKDTSKFCPKCGKQVANTTPPEQSREPHTEVQPRSRPQPQHSRRRPH